MTAEDLLRRHFSRMGARLVLRGPAAFQHGKVSIDVGRDRRGEFFDVRCEEGLVPEVVDVRPAARHLVLMVREGRSKSKFLLGHDERHWFAAAVPGDSVRDVSTAIDQLRPREARTPRAIRQGEWFFVPAPGAVEDSAVIHRREPLSRGAGSKPHICDEIVRTGGEAVLVSSAHPTGITAAEHEMLLARDPDARRLQWRRMVRNARVYARGAVRHPDHKTIWLDGWHRVSMNRERFAAHAAQIAFLD